MQFEIYRPVLCEEITSQVSSVDHRGTDLFHGNTRRKIGQAYPDFSRTSCGDTNSNGSNHHGIQQLLEPVATSLGKPIFCVAAVALL